MNAALASKTHDSAAAAPLRGELVSLSEYEARVPGIAALMQRSPEPNVFFHPAVLGALARAHGGAERWRVALALAGQDIVGAWPVLIEPARPQRPVPRFIARGHEYIVLSTPLIADGLAEAALAALLDALASAPDLPRVLALPFLGAGGAAEQALTAVIECSGRRMVTLDRYERAGIVTPPGGGAAYEARRFPNKDKRKKWRQECRKLDALGAVTLTRHRGDETVAAFEEFLALEGAGWKGRAGTAIASSAADSRFMRDAVAALAPSSGAEVFALRLDGRPIAAGLVLRAGREWWFHKIAYDEAHARAGPGARLAHELTLAMLDEVGIRFGDSCVLRGGGLLEGAWTDSREIADVMVSLEPGGSAAFTLAVAAERLRRAVRGTAKSVWHALKRARARGGG